MKLFSITVLWFIHIIARVRVAKKNRLNKFDSICEGRAITYVGKSDVIFHSVSMCSVKLRTRSESTIARRGRPKREVGMVNPMETTVDNPMENLSSLS